MRLVKDRAHLSQAGVEVARCVGASMGPFDCVVTSRITRTLETAIAMGFAVDEQLAALGGSSPTCGPTNYPLHLVFGLSRAALRRAPATVPYMTTDQPRAVARVSGATSDNETYGQARRAVRPRSGSCVANTKRLTSIQAQIPLWEEL